MDRKTRSQISNLLHYHSANAPCRGHYIETPKQMQVGKKVFSGHIDKILYSATKSNRRNGGRQTYFARIQDDKIL